MKKSESIQYMMDLGLNTLDCFISKDYHRVVNHVKKVSDSVKLSMRTERGTDFLCPFYYGVHKSVILENAYDLIKKGYKLLIYPYLDYKDSCAFGTVGIQGDGNIVVEYVMEPGLVRELDNHPRKTSLILNRPIKYVPCNPKVNEVVFEVMDKCHLEPACVVEWSYYNYPVGVFKNRIVYWEIRRYEDA